MRLVKYIEVKEYKIVKYVEGCCIESKRVPITWESQVNDVLEEMQEYGAKIISVGRPYAKRDGEVIPVEYEYERNLEYKLAYEQKKREEKAYHELCKIVERNRENAPSIREIIMEMGNR